MTDADLLQGARRGDAEAWRTLYQRYLPAVWRQAYALLSDVHAAEDVASETMLALLRSIDRLECDTPRIAGWLRAVVRCKAADYQRGQIRLRNKQAVAAGSAIECAPEASPSASMETAETQNHVLNVLDAMPDRQRTVLEWKYLESLGVREIAERTGESEKAVEAVLYRARREFRRLFELNRVAASAVHDVGAQVDTKPGS